MEDVAKWSKSRWDTYVPEKHFELTDPEKIAYGRKYTSILTRAWKFFSPKKTEFYIQQATKKLHSSEADYLKSIQKNNEWITLLLQNVKHQQMLAPVIHKLETENELVEGLLAIGLALPKREAQALAQTSLHSSEFQKPLLVLQQIKSQFLDEFHTLLHSATQKNLDVLLTLNEIADLGSEAKKEQLVQKMRAHEEGLVKMKIQEVHQALEPARQAFKEATSELSSIKNRLAQAMSQEQRALEEISNNKNRMVNLKLTLDAMPSELEAQKKAIKQTAFFSPERAELKVEHAKSKKQLEDAKIEVQRLLQSGQNIDEYIAQFNMQADEFITVKSDVPKLTRQAANQEAVVGKLGSKINDREMKIKELEEQQQTLDTVVRAEVALKDEVSVVKELFRYACMDPIVALQKPPRIAVTVQKEVVAPLMAKQQMEPKSAVVSQIGALTKKLKSNPLAILNLLLPALRPLISPDAKKHVEESLQELVQFLFGVIDVEVFTRKLQRPLQAISQALLEKASNNSNKELLQIVELTVQSSLKANETKIADGFFDAMAQLKKTPNKKMTQVLENKGKIKLLINTAAGRLTLCRLILPLILPPRISDEQKKAVQVVFADILATLAKTKMTAPIFELLDSMKKYLDGKVDEGRFKLEAAQTIQKIISLVNVNIIQKIDLAAALAVIAQ